MDPNLDTTTTLLDQQSISDFEEKERVLKKYLNLTDEDVKHAKLNIRMKKPLRYVEAESLYPKNMRKSVTCAKSIVKACIDKCCHGGKL